MCLAAPGQIIAVNDQNARVDFQGNRRDVNVMLTPEVNVGDWVLVHAGFAISTLDQAEAEKTWEYLTEIERLEELSP